MNVQKIINENECIHEYKMVKARKDYQCKACDNVIVNK